MALPGTARPMTACPRSPSLSPAPSGMARASLASGIRGSFGDGGSAMKAPSVKTVRCAIYTRVSTEHGLDQADDAKQQKPSAIKKPLGDKGFVHHRRTIKKGAKWGRNMA